MLSPEHRAELEALGPETVRMKLLDCGPGRGACPPGFTRPNDITRGDIEDWLVEKYTQESQEQHHMALGRSRCCLKALASVCDWVSRELMAPSASAPSPAGESCLERGTGSS
jgi:hypothetical protein